MPARWRSRSITSAWRCRASSGSSRTTSGSGPRDREVRRPLDGGRDLEVIEGAGGALLDGGEAHPRVEILHHPVLGGREEAPDDPLRAVLPREAQHLVDRLLLDLALEDA